MLKYINIDGIGIVTFSPTNKHSDIADLLTGGDKSKVISGGFFNTYDDISIGVYGEAFSIGVSSNGMDRDNFQRRLKEI